MRTRFWIMTGGGMALCLVLLLFSIAFGSTVIPFQEVLRALFSPVSSLPWSEPGPTQRIILELRVPRALLAIMIGGGLGVVGALMQTVTRNDLADPFLFGLSSGAAAGAVSVITVFGDRLGVWTLPIAAFTGGMLAAAIVLLLVNRMQGHGPERLILAGLAISFLFTALTNYMIFSGDQRAAHSILFWSLGGLGLARWGNLGLAAAGFLVILVFGLATSRKLDALLAGEQTAESLGVSVRATRNLVFLVCAFSTAIFVSLAGVIGFIGLMIPHLARPLTGPLHGRLLVLCAIFGACLLLASDLAARTILSPQELPIGIVTSSVGALFVLSFLLRRRW